MAYTKLGWVNDRAPALDQTNLNHMDQGIFDAHRKLSEYEDIFTGDVSESVQNWLDEHPEATTTVQDGSITEAKINPAFLQEILNNCITPQMYGAKGDGVTDDSQAIQDAIDDNPHSTIYFPDGNYKLGSTIYTWPDNERCVNLIFSENAEFFTSSSLECLFFIGGYDLTSNYGTTATLGHKKYFMGGRFNGANCEYAVKMSSATCDQQFMNCTFYNCNSALLMGHVTTARSIDSVIAYCNFIGTGAADSFGVKYMKADNKIQHCRIYGFKTCIWSAEGGVYAFDIHTLDLSETPSGYNCDDSCVVDFSAGGGRNTLLEVYGNGEGTFLRLNGSNTNLIKVCDCEYRNWTLSKSTFIFIDVLNDTGGVHLICTGNTVIADNPESTGRVRYGIRGLTVSNDYQIEDNIVWGGEWLTDRGDLICRTLAPQYSARTSKQMDAQWWYYVGALKSTTVAKTYKITISAGMNKFILYIYASTSNFMTTNVAVKKVEMSLNAGDYRLGLIQNGDTVEFYVGSNTARPYFDCITGFVEEPQRQYYLANIYKARSEESAYSQKGLGGSYSDRTDITRYYTFTLS